MSDHPPKREPTYSHGTSIRVTPEIRGKLQALKKELGFRNLSALFSFLVLEQTRGAVIPPASYELVFKDSRPVLLTGESGAGKTTTIRGLLKEYEGSAFILDVSDEYAEFERADLGRLFSLKWSKPGQRVRFVTDSNPDISKVEAATIFPRLAFEMHVGSLKDWLIVIEEGHRFGQDPGLRALLIEARKFTRKLILVTTDWRLYEGTARVFKPRPWESEGQATNVSKASASSPSDYLPEPFSSSSEKNAKMARTSSSRPFRRRNRLHSLSSCLILLGKSSIPLCAR